MNSWIVRLALARLRELSTWQALIAMLTAFGVQISPDLAEALIKLGVSAICVIGVLFPDRIEVRSAPFPVADAARPAERVHVDDVQATDDLPPVRFKSPDPNPFKDLDRFGSG